MEPRQPDHHPVARARPIGLGVAVLAILAASACMRASEPGDYERAAMPAMAEPAPEAALNDEGYAPAPSRREKKADLRGATGTPRPKPSRPAASKGGPGGRGGGGPSDSLAGKDKAEPDEVEAPGPRKVIYSGGLTVRATDAPATLKQAIALAEGAGGYVERLGATSVVLRVPAAEFRTIFAALVALGPVLTRSIAAQDVTDAFSALELRTAILKASRERLMMLLAKATTVRAKLELLDEIRRLTDEIDQLERQLQGMASLIAFSRISFEVQAPKLHVSSPADEPIAAMRWVHRLAPFNPVLANEEGAEALALTPPAGLVELPRRWWRLWSPDPWRAESADGCALWTHRRPNHPLGTSAFWQQAVLSRLGREYARAEALEIGPYKAVRLVYLDEPTAYRYLIALRADGDELEVIEATFPGAAQEERYGAAIRAAIEGGAS